TGAPAVSYSANGTNAAKNSTATFGAAGSYTFQVTIRDAGGLTVTSSVVVSVVQTLTSIVVSPVSVSLALGATQQFSASAKDQFGATMTTQPAFTWTLVSGLGTLTSTGLYTAPAGSTTASIRASAGGKTSNTATVTVTGSNTPPTVATPASATLNASKTSASLSVLGADNGGEANLTYTWAVTRASPGARAVTFSANGTNAAKNSTATFGAIGSYIFQVTIRDANGLTATSSVTVTVSQALTSLALLPGTVTLMAGATQSFNPWARDQFGN